MSESSPTASLLIIGNEILSGRTQDKNLNYIAKSLSDIGIRFMEARVIPDIPENIIEAVNTLRNKYDYVFTTGGIGPTHDDITTDCVAKAFKLEAIEHPDAINRLLNFYDNDPNKLTEARRRMARVPEGAQLIDNPISSAPGYRIENVFVMAGIPNVMQAMMDSARSLLNKGAVILSQEISAYVSESVIAEGLGIIQNKYPETDIGSYPFVKGNRFGTSIVIRSENKDLLEITSKAVKELLDKNGVML